MHISGKVRQLFRSTHSRRPKVNSTNTAFPQVNKLIKQLQISNKGSRTYSKGFSHKSPSKWELLNESDYYGADVEDPIVPCPEPKVKKPRNNKSRFTRFMTPTRKCGATFSSDHKSTSLNIHAGLFEGGASWRSPAESNGQALLGTTRTLCENREEKMNHCDEDESRKKIPSKPSLSPTEFPKPKESKENEKKMGKSALSFKVSTYSTTWRVCFIHYYIAILKVSKKTRSEYVS